MFNLNIKVLLTILLLATGVSAHPVIFKGGTVFETEQNTHKQHLGLSYTFHPKTAVAFDYLKFNDIKTEYYFAKLNHRLWRANKEDSQANIYLSAGAGQRRANDKLTTATVAQIHADWEDRDYYISGFQKYIHSEKSEGEAELDPIWQSRARVGLAPFRGDYNDVNVWFIAQFDKMNGEHWETTPLMRTYFKNILWEVGASLNGSYQLNLMFHL